MQSLQKIPFRITSSGIVRPSILTEQTDVDLFSGDMHENLLKAMHTEVAINMVQN